MSRTSWQQPVAPEMQIDPILLPLLRTKGAEADRVIDRLVTDAVTTIIDPILRSVVRPPSRDAFHELRGDVILRLLGRLRSLTEDAEPHIASFRDYAAVVTYHAFDDHMRRAFPQRARLKNRIRYVLGHDARFRVETRGREIVCALAPQARPVPAGVTLSDVMAEVLGGGAWMAIDELVTEVAERVGANDQAPLSLDERDDVAPPVDLLRRMETLHYLQLLWREIGELPVRQRAALLLNLRDPDGDSVVRLFPVTGIAGVREIAALLEIDAAEFAALWNDLPLPDITLAARLGITRQQVINLRKSARERLARRMARVV